MARVTLHELLAISRSRISRVTPLAAWQAMTDDGATLIDIRTAAQRASDGCVPGAHLVERNVLEWRLDPDSSHRLSTRPGLDDQIVVMCDEGYQSSLAAAVLLDLGFHRAADVAGGFQAWRAAGLRVTRTRIGAASRRG